MAYFSGKVHSVVFENAGNAFYILRMVLDTEPPFVSRNGTVTVKGHVPGMQIQIGSWFGFEADVDIHHQYGKQLSITKAPVLKAGWDAETAQNVLTAHGVGSRIVKQIRSHFGDDHFTEALSQPEELQKVPGIDSFTAQHVVERWSAVRTYFQTLNFLSEAGIPKNKIGQVWSTFGDQAETVLSTNPWALTQIDGITFAQLDEVAERMGLPMTSADRIRGAVVYCTLRQKGSGHMYLLSGNLFSEVNALVNMDQNHVAKVLAECHKEGVLVIDRKVKKGVVAIYEPWAHRVEKVSAELLSKRVESASFLALDPTTYLEELSRFGAATKKVAEETKDVRLTARAALDEWSAMGHIQLSEHQKEGVINALVEPVSLITGLPGTGKTLSMRAVVSILRDCGIEPLLMAPTGIAAKRLTSVTGVRATTIHRAFQSGGIDKNDARESVYAGVVGEGANEIGSVDLDKDWGYSQDSPHPARVVIVDEASMVDQHLLYRLLTCTSSTCRVVLVGDPAQLPSVGPGNVLRDLVRSDMFPTTALREIFRQEDTSDIVYAAHSIFGGVVPENLKAPSDFMLHEVESDEEALHYILRLAQECYDKRLNFQILSPRHAGNVGVTNLNSRLRELLNPKDPSKTEVKLGTGTMRNGDRVMVVKNDYKLDVYNGDVGKVNRIDNAAREVEVKIHGEPPMLVPVPFKNASRLLRLAYACTVHKAQGLEYDIIIMPIMDNFRHQLQRNLLYTAVTRAREKVVLVGTRSALAKAVANSREDARNTLLVERLESLCDPS